MVFALIFAQNAVVLQIMLKKNALIVKSVLRVIISIKNIWIKCFSFNYINEGFAEEDCKVCDVGDDKDKCIECHDNYELSLDRTSCQSKFIGCGNQTFEHCVKCSQIPQSNKYKCDECKYHYILDDNECKYDVNLTKYKYAINIKPKYFMMIFLQIIYFYFSW